MQPSETQPAVEAPLPPAPPSPETKPNLPSPDLSRIAQDLQIRRVQVEAVVQLLDEGNTVPFITRYRKERTGGLNEEVIRQIQSRVAHLRQLADRRLSILKSIEVQGKLTDELRKAILSADTTKRLEDLYLPYKPKKRTLATEARERGLEQLALAIWSRDPAVANLTEVLTGMLNPDKQLNTTEDVLNGAQHILAELIAETAEVRAAVRTQLWETAKLATTKHDKLKEGHGLDFKDYFEFAESVRQIPPHRILAINRGEKAGALKGKLDWDPSRIRAAAVSKLPLDGHPHAEFLNKVVDDALSRLLLPSLEREIRRELTDEAEDHAVKVFARNLRSLLLQPPLRGRRVLAIDPAFRTGCKLAALDETGTLLEEGVVFPFSRPEKSKHRGHTKPEAEKKEPEPSPAPAADQPASSTPDASAPGTPDASAPGIAVPVESPPQETAPPQAEATQQTEMPAPEATPSESPAEPGSPPSPAIPASVRARAESKSKLEDMLRKHRIEVIAIGNGTACRETEEVVAELISEKMPELAYVIVNEAGASVYSASSVGREEFPQFDATLRGTISIGRRLQDPLSELVKIDPQNIGVGLYQHDIQARRLKESLEAVVESCVNHVGVDINTASVPLLRHVSGLNQLVARELVDFRAQHGPFRSREQLLQVPNLGPARYTQAAGFLKILEGENPLDRTWIHPESYPATLQLLQDVGFEAQALADREKTKELQEKLKTIPVGDISNRLNVGVPTLLDIFEALARPGRDPREDLPPPIFKKGVLKLEDLQPGMELKGTVLNVVDFGAFVDIGLKDSGLVHISQMANRYIRNPYEIVAVGDVVTVWVLSVDLDRRRVSLTMIKPGTERKPPERKPQEARPPREEQGDRPPRRSGPPPKGRMIAVPKPGQQGGGNRQVAAQGGPRTGGPHPQGGHPKGPPPRPYHAQARKPARPPAKPKLSKAALEGAAPLRTFSELKAFFEAQQPEPQPPTPKAEEPPAPTPPEAKPPETRSNEGATGGSPS